jgi:hypothetical protein
MTIFFEWGLFLFWRAMKVMKNRPIGRISKSNTSWIGNGHSGLSVNNKSLTYNSIANWHNLGGTLV